MGVVAGRVDPRHAGAAEEVDRDAAALAQLQAELRGERCGLLGPGCAKRPSTTTEADPDQTRRPSGTTSTDVTGGTTCTEPAIGDSSGTWWAAAGESSMATRRPASSCPWQNGQTCTVRPHCSAKPGTSGITSRSPVASTSVREATTVPSARVVAKVPSPTPGDRGGRDVAQLHVGVRRELAVDDARNSAGSRPSLVTMLCMASTGALR